MGWGSRGCCPGRLDLLCVLALLGGCLLPVCRTRVYTNHWAVKIAGGFPEADRIASKYGFINIGQIGALKDYYHFYHSRTIKRSVLSSRGTHSFISMEPKVRRTSWVGTKRHKLLHFSLVISHWEPMTSVKTQISGAVTSPWGLAAWLPLQTKIDNGLIFTEMPGSCPTWRTASGYHK